MVRDLPLGNCSQADYEPDLIEKEGTDQYAPEHERTILWNDPELSIQWPIPTDESPTLSTKDREGDLMKDAELFD